MTSIGQLLHRTADQTLTRNERALLRCRLTKGLEAVAAGYHFERAAELPVGARHHATKERLVACARRAMRLSGVLPTPPGRKGSNFYEAVRRFGAGLVGRALRGAGGVLTRAAQSSGINRQSLGTMPHAGRHRGLARLRAPAEPRRKSLMFRDGVDCPAARAVAVLHVEDDALVADGVRLTLGAEGWSVETCGDGGAALEKLSGAGRYDVLIFDNRLPDTDGVELIRRTRALAHRRQTPIIVLSADDVEAQARRAGASAFLPKPAGVALIAETVARLLARRKGGET